MANSGYKGWSTLEQYYTDTSAATGVTKPNIPSDANYVAPVYDLTACPVDSIKPTPPISLWFLSSSLTSISFQWSGATDNVAVNHYHIVVIGVGAFETANEWLTVENLTPGTYYEVHVWAVDIAENTSAGIVNNFSTAADVNNSISINPWNVTFMTQYGDMAAAEITSNYTELNFSCPEYWVALYPSGYSNNLTLQIEVESNYDYNNRYATVYIYNGTTYVASLTIDQPGTV